MDTDYYNLISRVESEYAACRFDTTWKVNEITCGNNATGFIVQKFKRIVTPTIKSISDISYYEAWKVENGTCIDANNTKPYDDSFALFDVDTFNVSELLAEGVTVSAGTAGEVVFIGEVYWVPKEDRLARIVNGWKFGQVADAGELRSTWCCPELEQRTPLFSRKFVHSWDMVDEEKIVKVATKVLKNGFANDGVRERKLKDCIQRMNVSTKCKARLLVCLNINQ